MQFVTIEKELIKPYASKFRERSCSPDPEQEV
jgi:hypothetical protein